jgi:flagellar hook protein FlgE
MGLTALFTGASGLDANSFALDVVGNNLANLNTTGYKSQTTLFKDAVYQTLNPGSAPSGGSGGTNPSQDGFGVNVGAIDSTFNQGSVTPTASPLDAAIQGRGFFVLSNGQSQVYSRAGSFAIDAGGYLVDPNSGFRVQRSGNVGEGTATTPGFQVPGNNDVRVPLGAGIAGTETANVTFQGNLSSTTPVGQSTTTAIQVYDSQDTPRSLSLTFTNTAANTWTATAQISGGTATIPAGTITFDSAGLLVGPSTLTANITGLTGAANQTITLNLGTPGQTTGLTQFGGTATATATTQDGSGFGTLTSVSFDNTGTIQGAFSNGRTVPIAQLGIAGFTNDGGLDRNGSNFFVSSAASGSAIIGTANSGGLGSVMGSSLEGSNVDVSSEFSKLIVAQRGFEINARTITVADQTLQALTQIQ